MTVDNNQHLNVHKFVSFHVSHWLI